MSTPPLTDAEIEAGLTTLPGWERRGDVILRTFRLDSYLAGLAFAAAVGTIAEGLDHHPEMLIGWKRVTVSFTTHDAGSRISAKDLQAAAAVNALGYPRAGA